jgi:hypothetical protein
MNKVEWRSGTDYQRDISETNRYRREKIKKQLIRSILIGIGILLLVSVLSYVLVERVNRY